MCPACIASAAWLITSVISTGGLTALAVKKLGAKQSTEKSFQNPNHKEEPWGK